MSSAIAIPHNASTQAVMVSVSPTSSPLGERSIHSRIRQPSIAASIAIRQPKVLHPVENEDLRLLLLENISQEAVKAFQAQGFTVDHSAKAMSEEELVEKIGQYHAIGIRSKTKITERVIKAASKVRISYILVMDTRL
jgi:D-3-phosphoglycerate dehydrogenase / 2-oxoglutarate reductase